MHLNIIHCCFRSALVFFLRVRMNCQSTHVREEDIILSKLSVRSNSVHLEDARTGRLVSVEDRTVASDNNGADRADRADRENVSADHDGAALNADAALDGRTTPEYRRLQRPASMTEEPHKQRAEPRLQRSASITSTSSTRRWVYVYRDMPTILLTIHAA